MAENKKSSRVGMKGKRTLWDRMKHLAIVKNDATGNLLDEAMEQYLEREEAK